ncbi:MAG: DUF853 family protein [Rhodomicrobium sp.]|nr:DUF853 family protein [Rhodomicrobium sp.]
MRLFVESGTYTALLVGCAKMLHAAPGIGNTGSGSSVRVPPGSMRYCVGSKGAPSMVDRTLIRPPSSRLGPLTPEERRAVIAASPVKGVYDEAVDRTSAHEMLQKQQESAGAAEDGYDRHGEFRVPKAPGRETGSPRSSGRDTAGDAFFKSLARSVAPCCREFWSVCCGAATGADERRPIVMRFRQGIIPAILLILPPRQPAAFARRRRKSCTRPRPS